MDSAFIISASAGHGTATHEGMTFDHKVVPLMNEHDDDVVSAASRAKPFGHENNAVEGYS